MTRAPVVPDAIEVFVAEDDPHDASVLRTAAERVQLPADRLMLVEDGERAIRWLCGKPMASLKLVILDFKLPKKSGLEVLKRLRSDSKHASTPVVMMSGSPRSEDMEACYQAGASGYVVKSGQFEEHLRDAESVLRFWTQANRRPDDRDNTC